MGYAIFDTPAIHEIPGIKEVAQAGGDTVPPLVIAPAQPVQVLDDSSVNIALSSIQDELAVTPAYLPALQAGQSCARRGHLLCGEPGSRPPARHSGAVGFSVGDDRSSATGPVNAGCVGVDDDRHCEVDGGASGFGQLGPEGDGEPHPFGGVDGETVHEVGRQGRITGQFDQVDALGEEPLGVRAVEKPTAQRFGQGGGVAEQRCREP